MKYMEATLHVPVLLQEAVDGLALQKGDVVVDATLGGGGHTREILEWVLPAGKVIALDRDLSAIDHFREAAKSDALLTEALADGSLRLLHRNYSSLGEVLETEGVATADAVLADLGFSSDQIEDGKRGFSFQKNGPLDMRLDRDTELTAEKIVNTYPAGELERILSLYGDEKESRRIAMAIVSSREKRPLKSTEELRAIIEAAYPKSQRSRLRIHPATKTFQALRIAVNEEYEHLERFLSQAAKHLRVGGRLAVITFHSGEDRIVSQFFKSQARGCICPPGFPICLCQRSPDLKILTKKPLRPSEGEVRENPRSRSARLRIAEKL